MDDIIWTVKSFDELTASELYTIIKARVDVFVVEQECPYPDLDGYDQQALHLWAVKKGEIAAYCRIFAPAVKYPDASIGRVLTTQKHRRMKLGKVLMKFAISTIEARYRTSAIRISAQDYLLKFYGDLGFEDTGRKYLEDDIPHTEMVKR